jgi:hypothetical protein
VTSSSRLADPPQVNGFRAVSAVRAERVARWANRTDGKLALLVAAVIVVGLAAGLAGALDVRDRASVLDDVAGHSGPLTVASVEVYRALSDADATSASAFLAGGTEPADLRQRYLNDIAAANAALSTAAAGAPTGESAAKVAELANHVPTYTGLVETARTYNRQGLPLGAAYLREASELVRSTMLPAAQRLYEIETDRLAASQADAGRLPWFAIVLGLLLIGGFIAIQLYLARRTRRMLNPGLLIATGLALASLIWLVAGAASSAGHSDASRTDGTAQLEALAEARIAGLQARSDEAMTLVARGNGAAFEQHFDATAKKLTEPGGLLERARQSVAQPDTREAVDTASGAAQRWVGVNTELRKLDREGKYTDAVTMATGSEPGSSASLARGFDGSLGAAIQQATARFDLATADAQDALSGLAIGIVALCVLAVVAAAVGMWPRIAEYR